MKKQMPKRNTLKNLLSFMKTGDFIEILKILRRRALNTVRFARHHALRFIGSVYNLEPLKVARQKRQLNYVLRNFFGVAESNNESKKCNIAVIVRDGNALPKSSTFIRLISPLTTGSLGKKTSVHLYPEDSLEVDATTSVCIVQRTAYDNSGDALMLIKYLADCKIPLIIDTDDAFSEIDKKHPEHKEQQARLQAKELLLQHASRVWVSTPQLRSILPADIQKKTLVIENTLDERLWKKQGKKRTRKQSTKLQLLYMGTATHDGDFALILPALKNLHAKYPGRFELTVIGAVNNLPELPWIKRLVQKSSMYPLFVEWFLERSHKFDIGLSPLVDSAFNKAKSDIKCLDYLAAGVVPYVSNLLPYSSKELDGLVVRINNSPTEWKNEIEKAIIDIIGFRDKKKTIIQKGQDYIWSKRSTEKASRLMEAEINKLLGS